MLQKSTIHFLSSLHKNNNKEWFEKNRKAYEGAKADFLELTQNLIKGIAKFDASIGHLEPKKCVFRINRDVRFSKNKAPYKNNMGASMNKGGKKIMKAGYYFHVEPSGESFVAGGIYMPENADLQKLRQEIDYNFTDFKKIVNSTSFLKQFKTLSDTEGMKLSRPPKGYETDNPAIEYLKYKSFIATSPIATAQLTDKDLVKNTLVKFKTLYPLVQFINEAMEG
jgi:uncharacterized protein (TIGR02453 family)